MKIMFSAGEASGDLHGANLARALKQLAPDIELLGMGGEKMRDAGVDIVYDIDNLGVIGIGEIIRKIPFFFRLRDFLVDTMKKENPDVLVCIDYPGFNMRLIKAAKATGIPVIYYILPTIWAWHKSRGKTIAKYTDLAISLFPFEAKLYEDIGTNVLYTGHPLLDSVHPSLSRHDAFLKFGLSEEKRTILLMPGSRVQEVTSLLPCMLEAAKQIERDYGDLQFLIPRATTIDRAMLDDIIASSGMTVTVGEGNVYDMMNISTAAIAASGTATLETALMGLPTLLVYRVNRLTYWLSKILVHIESIGLPNIIMGRRVIPELWQDDVTPDNIADAVLPMLDDGPRRAKLCEDLSAVRRTMGESGAVMRTAQAVLTFARERGIHEAVQ